MAITPFLLASLAISCRSSSPPASCYKKKTEKLKGASAAGVPLRLAHSVSVLYIRVPGDIEGGELCLRRPTRDEGGNNVTYKKDDSKRIDAEVGPVENVLCRFRGDAEHAVRTFSSSKGNRISLVLEQYKIPKGDESFLLEFETVQQHDYMKIRL